MSQISAILGIDPGSLRTGWGVVIDSGGGVLSLVDCGIIRTSSKDGQFSDRLAFIYRELSAVIARTNPGAVAIEQVFCGQNPSTALKLGQARGVAVAAGAAAGLRIFDYEPTLVKQSIAGTGRADKEQVAFMIGRLLNTEIKKMPLDVTDALAVAVCHLNQSRFQKLAAKARQTS